MPKKKQLVSLDFTEYDTIQLLEMLITMCHDNRVAGMVYAVSLKHGTTARRDVICGATGKLADDHVQAAGLTAMLNHKFSMDAISIMLQVRE